MKLSLLSEGLQKKLSFANHAISSRNQLPILSHFLLEAKDGKLKIAATDLEIGIETFVPASIEEEGGVTIPAKLFLELINAISQEKISLQTKDGGLEVVSKKTKSLIQTSPKEEFPTLIEEKGQKELVMQGKEFKKYFSKVVFAASIESTRPALSGVLVKRQGSVVALVATDGYRLSFEKMQGTEDAKEHELSLLIPVKVLREALSLSDEQEIVLYSSKKKNQIVFEQEDISIVGRLIEAEFPQYEKIIPTDFSTKITFDREEMLKAVKTCAIFARETANIVTLSLQKEKITLSAKTASLGENTDEVEAKLTGEENDIAFNVRYLIEFLSNVQEEEVLFEMTGPLNPGVFHVVGNENFLHLIMPIRTQG
ncbi:MAG: DNA polymerase III subunit beta [Candidatus Levyibacteriota bacterium]